MSETWAQVLTILGGMATVFFANLGIIWWFRRECREDWKMCNQEISSMREEFKQFREMWAAESKDFHERLLKIEMERK